MRVSVFIGVLFILSVVSALDFQATFTRTGGGLVGTETGNIFYRGNDDVNLQKQRIEINGYNAGVVTTEIYDFVTGTSVTFSNCGGGCKGAQNKAPFPKYWRTGATQTGNSATIAGENCQEYTQAAEPKTFWLKAGTNVPCRGIFSSGIVYTFSGASEVSTEGRFSTAGWNCPSAKCTAPLNVMLVMDRSGSISGSQWDQFRSFAVKLVGGFTISPSDVNVGTVLFSSRANLAFGIQNNYQTAYNSILGMQRGGTGNTCIGCGLDLARTQFNNHGRRAKNVYIVMTDGMNNEGSLASSVKAARDSGIVIAVGVGAANRNYLLNVATDASYIFYVSNFADLDTILETLLKKTCSIADQIDSSNNQCGAGCRGSCACGNICQCPSSCDDGNACTADKCDPALNGAGCRHDTISCDDGKTCTVDTCDAASGCQHTDLKCDDNNKCTNDACKEPGGCLFTPVVCNDNNYCTTDTCDPATGKCIFTDISLSCNDNNPCTIDSCDPKSGCKFTSKLCNDGKNCTVDTCDPKSTLPDPCVFTSVASCKCEGVVCKPKDPCRPTICEPSSGECIVVPVCNDNNACTNDTCDVRNGNCFNTPINCTHTNQCLVPSCNITSGCVFTTKVCDDGNVFTNDTCNPNSGCQYTIKDCNDNDACTRDYFNGTTLKCVHEPLPASACDDLSVCTEDSCEPAVGCVHKYINCSGDTYCNPRKCNSLLGCQNTTQECRPENHCKYGYCDLVLDKCTEREFQSANETDPDYKCDPVCATLECQFASLTDAEKAGVIIGSAAIAGIVVGGAVGLGLLIFGGKKGYDYLMARNAGKAALGNNPLYVDDNRQGANPLYKE